MTTNNKMALALLLLVALGGLLYRCHAADRTMGLAVVGFNHTDHDIGDFLVDGQGGAYEGKHEGGKATCCISIPHTYKPGMTVTVAWTDENDEHSQSRVVPVPPYTPEDAGEFHVHFLRNGQIKVFVTMVGLVSSPDYPLKGDEARM